MNAFYPSKTPAMQLVKKFIETNNGKTFIYYCKHL